MSIVSKLKKSLLNYNPAKRREIVKKQFAQEMRLIPSGQYEPGDVFISGYPKSGNTWLQTLMAGVLYGVDVQRTPIRLIIDMIPDSHEPYYRRYATPTIFKTHSLPDPQFKRVINIVRDGRDAMVSYYHFQEGLGKSSKWEHLIEHGTAFGLWHNHVEEWLANPFEAEIIVVRYEDLLAQPLVEMKRIRKFLSLDVDDLKLQDAIEKASFNKMQKSEAIFGMGNEQFSSSHSFVRSGQSGNHKDLPEHILARLNQQMFTTLEKLGYSL